MVAACTLNDTGRNVIGRDARYRGGRVPIKDERLIVAAYVLAVILAGTIIWLVGAIE